MKGSYIKRYRKRTDEELFIILVSDLGEYTETAIEAAQDVLRERGHQVDMVAFYIQLLEDYTDEDLIIMIESEEQDYQPVVNEAIRKILLERGYDIEQKEIVYSDKKPGCMPLIVGIVLIAINFYLSGLVYQYQVTGIANQFFIDYINNVGLFHDIMIRLIVVGMIAYYRQKQGGKYLGLWLLAGLIIGAWALIVVGVLEYITDYSEIEQSESEA